MSNNKKTKSIREKEAVLKGFQQAAQTLRNIHTTVEDEGVVVTITAEPAIIGIQIKKNTNNLSVLSGRLKECLNRAFKESSQKVLEKTIKEIDF